MYKDDQNRGSTLLRALIKAPRFLTDSSGSRLHAVVSLGEGPVQGFQLLPALCDAPYTATCPQTRYSVVDVVYHSSSVLSSITHIKNLTAQFFLCISILDFILLITTNTTNIKHASAIHMGMPQPENGIIPLPRYAVNPIITGRVKMHTIVKYP